MDINESQKNKLLRKELEKKANTCLGNFGTHGRTEHTSVNEKISKVKGSLSNKDILTIIKLIEDYQIKKSFSIDPSTAGWGLLLYELRGEYSHRATNKQRIS